MVNSIAAVYAWEFRRLILVNRANNLGQGEKPLELRPGRISELLVDRELFVGIPLLEVDPVPMETPMQAQGSPIGRRPIGLIAGLGGRPPCMASQATGSQPASARCLYPAANVLEPPQKPVIQTPASDWLGLTGPVTSGHRLSDQVREVFHGLAVEQGRAMKTAAMPSS